MNPKSGAGLVEPVEVDSLDKNVAGYSSRRMMQLAAALCRLIQDLLPAR